MSQVIARLFFPRWLVSLKNSRRVVSIRGTKATVKGYGTCSVPLFLSDGQSRLGGLSKKVLDLSTLWHIWCRFVSSLYKVHLVYGAFQLDKFRTKPCWSLSGCIHLFVSSDVSSLCLWVAIDSNWNRGPPEKMWLSQIESAESLQSPKVPGKGAKKIILCNP